VALVQRLVDRLNFRIGLDLGQRLMPHFADDFLHHFRAIRSLDHKR